MAKGNGNGKKKIGGKLGARAGERDKGGKEREVMKGAIGGIGQSASQHMKAMLKSKKAEQAKADAKKKAAQIIKKASSKKQKMQLRDIPLPKSSKFKGWE